MKTLRYSKFTFRGFTGSVDSYGFVRWATLSCSHASLGGELRELVDKLLKEMQSED